ncbi:MAG TPA: leucyl/phenylalanyl-tRNA--protein transferase [Burkholderiales bacterium]
MYVIDPHADDFRFPPVELASPDGLLAVGGDLRPARLLAAYRQGIFPWYNEGQPILWWSPDPRAVLFPARLRVSRSLRKRLRSGKFRVTCDVCFRDVMLACAGPRPQYPHGGTWITPAMVEAYTELHRLGHAHSVETWLGDRLVGGLYGVALGGIFCGESMFSRESDASKVALVYLVRQLERWGYALIDCQLPSAHLASLGAEAIPRRTYMALLADALALPGRPPPWRFDTDLPIV